MKKILDRFSKAITYFSYQESQKRALALYRKEKQRLEAMDIDELELEYIDTKCAYEHKKNCLTVILVSILISILMSAWNFFGGLIKSAMQNLMLSQNAEVYEVGLILGTILIIFLTFIVAWFLISNFREIKRLYRKILLIECVKKERGIA